MGAAAAENNASWDGPRCYNCGVQGHLTVACPEPTRTIPAGLEAYRQQQASSTDSKNSKNSKNKNKARRGMSSSSQSRHHNGMVVTRYPPPPASGEVQATHYAPRPPSHLPPTPSVSLPPPPHSANGTAYRLNQHHHSHHGFPTQHHPAPPPQSQSRPVPEPWTYPLQPHGFAGPPPPGPPPAAQAPLHYPPYDTYGASSTPTAPPPVAQHPGPHSDSAYYSQSFGPPPGYFATPPPGVTGPPVVPPPSFIASYTPPASHLPPHLPPPFQQQYSSAPNHPGQSDAYFAAGSGLPAYPPIGGPPSTLPSQPKYPQGLGNGSGWRPKNRGGSFPGASSRGGRTGFNKDRGPRNPNMSTRHGSSDKNISSGPGSSRIHSPASLSAPHSGNPSKSITSTHTISPLPSSIPAKPPTPISVSRTGWKSGNRTKHEARKADLGDASTHSSPHACVGSVKVDAHIPPKRTRDSSLSVEEDRSAKRARPSPTEQSPFHRPNSTPGTITSSTSIVNGRKRSGNGGLPHNSPSSRNDSPNLPNGPPWSSRPPNRILSYGTGDPDSNSTSAQTDSGYHSNNHSVVESEIPATCDQEKEATAALSAQNNLPSQRPSSSGHQSSNSRGRSQSRRLSTMSASPSQTQSPSHSRSRGRSPDGRPSQSPEPESRQNKARRSKSRSSSPLDDLEREILGMASESDGEDKAGKKRNSRLGNDKIKRRKQPRVAPAAYSRRW